METVFVGSLVCVFVCECMCVRFFKRACVRVCVVRVLPSKCVCVLHYQNIKGSASQLNKLV